MRFQSIVGAACTAFALLAGGAAARPASRPGDGAVRRHAAPLPRRRPAPVLARSAAAFKADAQRRARGLPAADAAAIDDFYAGRDYAPFWTEPGSDRAAADLAAALDASAGAGAAAARRRHRGARRSSSARTPPTPAAVRPRGGGDAAPTSRFARDLTAGVLVPSPVIADIRSASRAAPRPAALLGALDTAPVAEVLAGFAAGRSRLWPADRREGAARGAGPDRAPGGRTVPDGATLHPGETEPAGRGAARRGWRGSAISCRPPRSPGSDFDPTLQDAVEAFQRDYGLNDDGVVGAHDARRDQRAGRDAGWRRWRSTSSGCAGLNRDPGAALPPRQHPRLHRAADRGRQDHLGVEGRGRQDPRHRDAGVLRGGEAPWSSTRPGTSRTRSRSATTCRSCRRTRWC